MEAGEDCSSFWEPRSFYRTTQRVTDGRRLCKDLVALLKERADIEKDYAKKLRGWANKWRDVVENGPEYGTTEALWKGFLTEAEKLADLHLNMKDKLRKDVIVEVKDWAKDMYHKSMLQIKEKKEMEDLFKKAQQPWEKLLNKVEEAKIEYYSAFRTERSTFHQVKNALSDPDLTLSQVTKIQDRSIKCKENLIKAKEKYEEALRDIHLYNTKYIEDMTAVFNKCQEMEGQRLQFFKKIMFSVYKCFNLSQNPNYLQIYDEFSAVIGSADAGKDLRWWSQNYGAHMDMKWPVFEEYKEGLREIVKGKSTTDVACGTTLIHWRSVGENSYKYSPKSEMSAHDQPYNSGDNSSEAKKKTETSFGAAATDTRYSTNPFDEDDSDNDTGETFLDYGEAGILVRALYDYEAKEIDELDLKEGDIFEKIEEQDAQGWCKGRKDGRVGLYPAQYVEVVDQ